ncbi:MAG: preprotein translocase subunit SecE [Clostridiales bacterium]|jgi:preprotein translocase SecE subunit|nr:preprotein translocase subunit SecE [Clostridiales bacterium]
MEDKRKDDDKGLMDTAGGWWNGIMGEFKRITWPTRQQLAKMTIAAIVVSGIVGAIIVGYDTVLGYAYGFLADTFRPN